MGHRRKRVPGPQQHAEGQHGEKTHRQFIKRLQEPLNARDADEISGRPVEGHHRLHQDRQQHDEAEKDSEKTEAAREVERGHVDDSVLAHARIPRDRGRR